MAEVLRERLPPESRALPDRDVLGEMVSSLSLVASGAVEGAEGVPDFFVRELLFPYTAGTAWIRQKRGNGNGWSGIEEAYRHPPEATSEILHPDRKGARSRLAPADRPSTAAVPQGGKTLYSDCFGEWVLGQLLERAGAGAKAPELAAAWQDDRILFFERPGTPSPGIGFSWRIRCASPADAGRLAAALSPLYTGRPSGSRPSVRSRGEVVSVDLGTVTARRAASTPPGERRKAGSR